MRRTLTFNVDLQRLERTGPTGVLVIRLMRAANDLAVANAGYRRYSQPGSFLEEHIRPGARRYFVRLQCGHLAEALPLVKKVRHNGTLRKLLEGCSGETQAAFERLFDCRKGGTRFGDFERYVKGIRDKVAFHYDGAPIARALRARATRPETRFSLVTLGTDIDLWRFTIADDIEASVVVRELWQVPRESNLQAEDDRISGFGSDLCRDFIQFAGELSTEFLRAYAQA